MKGFIGASLVVVCLLYVSVILGSYIATTQVKLHLIGEMETQIKDNKAYLALMAILSRTENGKAQTYRLVEDLVNERTPYWIGEQLEKLGFECYILKEKREKEERILLQKECEGVSYQFASIVVPLPRLNSTIVSLGVG
ncbi:MAG: hypothetical protein J7K98_00860 [Candidatus Aenigmarchaeota archaeon]|nr:hypothetical protein [Candidatus Aenigmarchaeota archaeon]